MKNWDQVWKKWKGLKRKNKNLEIQIFLVFVVIGYGLFFTSKMWYPTSSYIEATAYYQRSTYAGYDIYITQWEYSEADAAMQIILELENQELINQLFQFSAVERNRGAQDLEVVVEDPEFVVLRIEDLPKSWKELSLRIETEEEQEPLRLYTNVDDVKKVEALEEKEETGYRIDRLLAQIAYDDMQIEEKKEKIADLQDENAKINERIEVLENETYPSEEEAKNALDTITRAETQQKTNQNNIVMLQEEIEKLNQRTSNIREQIEQIKK